MSPKNMQSFMFGTFTAGEPARPTMRPRVFALTLASKSEAKIIACYLIEMSQWFSITPLPEDEWEVEVKLENEKLLLQAAGRLVGTHG